MIQNTLSYKFNLTGYHFKEKLFSWDHFLIPSIDNAFGDIDVVFQDNYASCHRAKCVRDFLVDEQIAIMDWPLNNPNLNSIKNM